MKRRISRSEKNEAVITLNDLGFTVSAIAYMIGSTTMNVYQHLKRARRFKNREAIRTSPSSPTPGVLAALRKLSDYSEWQVLTLYAVALAKTNSPGALPAGATKRISKRSGKKAA